MNKPPHIEINQLDEGKKKSMKSRVIVGIILAVLGFPAMFIGWWPFFIFISFFLGFAIYELTAIRRKRYNWFVWVFTYLVTLSYVYWSVIKLNLQGYLSDPTHYTFVLESQFMEPGISWVTVFLMLGGYFIIGIFHKDFDIVDITILSVMSLLVGLGFQCLLYLRYHPIAYALSENMAIAQEPLFRFMTSSFLFLFVLVATFGNDIFAYFVGVFFGKHKMNPRVSPNKSWEGFFGGWIIGGALAFGFACIVDATGHPIVHSLRIFGDGNMWWAVAILSWTLPLIANVGDLTLSLIKRFFGIKDYGKLLAAHGGVLDRVDSLIFCCIFCSILVVLFEKGLGFFA